MNLLNIFFHADQLIVSIISIYGAYVYAFLFFIVFMETGFVLTPFLPGDSLIFISGTLASSGNLNVFLLFLLFSAAAILGDSANYFIGYFLGEKFFIKFIKKKNIDKTKDFFDRHGKQTIILARFAPIIRTMAPFIAGIGKMKFRNFLTYNVVGAFAWVALFLLAGFFFGQVPFVKNNISIIIVLIVVISFIPIFLEYFRGRKKK